MTFAEFGFTLPDFAGWTRDDWIARGDDVRDLIAAGHGWDVTDFGAGMFESRGLVLFTLRNGLAAGGPTSRPYAEKIMISRQDQLTPMHRHAQKTEDIINRSSLSDGATLAIKLFGSDGDGNLSETHPVTVWLDGRERDVEPGTIIELEPGQSITLYPGVFHAFWGRGGDIVVGEVSTVNDDRTDNFFAEPVARFTGIEEDEPPLRPLVSDHPLA